MQLKIAHTVIGNPDIGDQLHLTFDDDSTIVLTYEPHNTFDNYIWRPVGRPSYVRSAQKLLKRRGIEKERVRCYVDDTWISAGQLLHLVLVPHGNMSDWPRFTSSTKIKLISIT